MLLEGLDALDQQIVALLIENARLSYSDIGEKVGLSRVAVKSRIQALEQRGVIEEYTTIINPQKLTGAVSCYFELEFSPAGFGEAVARLRPAHRHPNLPGDRQPQAPRPRRGRHQPGDGGPAPQHHRPPARPGEVQLQRHPLPD